MKISTLERELARLAPTPDPRGLTGARERLMSLAAAEAHQHGDVAAAMRGAVPRVHPRRVMIRVGIAAALAVGSAVGVTLWPDPAGNAVPAAYAAWRAVPEPVSPGHMQEQASACLADVRSAAAHDAGTTHGLAVDDMAPVVAERRGSWTFTLLVAGRPGSHTESSVTCLSSDEPGSGGGWGGSAGPSAGAPARDAIQWMGAGSGDHWFYIWGYAGAEVSRVTATLSDGVVVETTLTDGYFAAWWPIPGSAPDPFALTWFLADGSEGGTAGWTTP